MLGFFPPISLLNISVYRLQPRLFIDSPQLNLYVSLIMTLICLDPCQWSLMSLITGNKVKKHHTSHGGRHLLTFESQKLNYFEKKVGPTF
jgi:hypothetical protein